MMCTISPSWRFKILEKSRVLGVSLLWKRWTLTQTPETPKTPCVFGKAKGCPGCFLRSEGWVEQSESCHRKRWKLPAKIPQISAKLPQISAKTCKSQNDGELTFSDSQGLGMAPLESVALSHDMKRLKLQIITGKRKLLIFSRRMNHNESPGWWFLGNGQPRTSPSLVRHGTIVSVLRRSGWAPSALPSQALLGEIFNATFVGLNMV